MSSFSRRKHVVKNNVFRNFKLVFKGLVLFHLFTNHHFYFSVLLFVFFVNFFQFFRLLWIRSVCPLTRTWTYGVTGAHAESRLDVSVRCREGNLNLSENFPDVPACSSSFALMAPNASHDFPQTLVDWSSLCESAIDQGGWRSHSRHHCFSLLPIHPYLHSPRLI